MKWILAFDAGCSSCRDLARRVQDTAGQKLTIRSLADPEIVELRRRAAPEGTSPKWVPTLLRVDGGSVRAWTGPAMSARLARLLGPRRALRLARATQPPQMADAGRRRLLRLAPAAALGAFALSGGTAFASSAKTGSGGDLSVMDAIDRAFGINRNTTHVTPNVTNASSVLEKSAASLDAQAFVSSFGAAGLGAGSRVAEKMVFDIHHDNPALNPTVDVVRTELLGGGTRRGWAYHVIGANGERVFSFSSLADGNLELRYHEWGAIQHTVFHRQTGGVVSSTVLMHPIRVPTSAIVSHTANAVPHVPFFPSCPALCGALCSANFINAVGECIVACLAGGPEDEPLCAPICALIAAGICIFGCSSLCCACCNQAC